LSDLQIADELEAGVSVASRIVAVAGEFAPDYNIDQIYDRLIEIVGNVAAMKNICMKRFTLSITYTGEAQTMIPVMLEGLEK